VTQKGQGHDTNVFGADYLDNGWRASIEYRIFATGQRIQLACQFFQWTQCQKYFFHYVSDDGFWLAAKTGGRRTPVTFGRQPTQVFGRPCRSTKSVTALRRNFSLERLTGEKECRKWYETRPWMGIPGIPWTTERFWLRRAVWNRC